MHRSKPYSRPAGNPDAAGSWSHDMYTGGTGSSSLASRISGSSGADGGGFGKAKSPPSGSLLSRISGSQKGRELLSGPSSGATPSPKMHGYAANLPASTTNANSGVELFPMNGKSGKQGGVLDAAFDQRAPGQGASGKPMGRSVFTSGLVAAGLGASAERERPRRELVQPASTYRQGEREAVSILGQGKIWVRVENLAEGTTPEDVQSAFAPSPILSARTAPSSTPGLVSIDLEYSDRAAAEELVKTYNGVVADGNPLKVSIQPPISAGGGKQSSGLAGRLGGATVASGPAGGGGLSARLGSGNARNGDTGSVSNGHASSAGQELFAPPSGSKMYSDTILRSNPAAGVTTLSDNTSSLSYGSDPAKADRRSAWASGGGGRLSDRVGRGGSGGGMVVDW